MDRQPIRVWGPCELSLVLRRLAVREQRRVVIVLMGAQGSGKSTLASQLQRILDGVEVVALDQIRFELCGHEEGEDCDYQRLQTFMTPARERRVRRIARGRFRASTAPFVLVDQMNLFPSSRAPYLCRDNFNVGLVMQVPLKRVLEQHSRRADKLAAIRRNLVAASYMRRVAPQPGEFDLVIEYAPMQSSHRNGREDSDES